MYLDEAQVRRMTIHVDTTPRQSVLIDALRSEIRCRGQGELEANRKTVRAVRGSAASVVSALELPAIVVSFGSIL